jgi:hypothetical protein
VANRLGGVWAFWLCDHPRDLKLEVGELSLRHPGTSLVAPGETPQTPHHLIATTVPHDSLFRLTRFKLARASIDSGTGVIPDLVFGRLGS